MNLHNAIRDFTARYDRNAISSIQDLATNSSMTRSKFLFKAVDVKKATDLFVEYLDGYAKFKIGSIGSDDSEMKAIMERTEMFLTNDGTNKSMPVAFEEVDIHYSDIPEVCKDYIESVQRVMDAVNRLTTDLSAYDVKNDDIGALTEMSDMYISHLFPLVEKVMYTGLCASGYEHKKWTESLFNRRDDKKPAPIFI